MVVQRPSARTVTNILGAAIGKERKPRMRLTHKPISVVIDGSEIRMRRTTGGVVELWGQDDVELARGMGFAHAHDRMVQMMLARLVGQGRLSECIKSDDETLAIDIAMRQMGFASSAQADVDGCSERAAAIGRGYCAGVNEYLSRFRPPYACPYSYRRECASLY